MEKLLIKHTGAEAVEENETGYRMHAGTLWVYVHGTAFASVTLHFRPTANDALVEFADITADGVYSYSVPSGELVVGADATAENLTVAVQQ